MYPYAGGAGTKITYPSLAYNGIIGGFWSQDKAAKLAIIEGASSKIFATHNSLWAYGYINPDDFHRKASTNPATDRNVQEMFPHTDGSVILYCDGHAKWASRQLSATRLVCSDTISNYGAYDFSTTATTGTVCGYWSPMVKPPA
jgi:prepilin-type processing-associated H-X9-DG protein